LSTGEGEEGLRMETRGSGISSFPKNGTQSTYCGGEENELRVPEGGSEKMGIKRLTDKKEGLV